MHLLAVGLNHKSAPVAVRERVALAGDQIVDAARDLTQTSDITETTIVSTCNRTEIYCRQDDLHPPSVQDWICSYSGLQTQDLTQHIYHYPDEQAVKHAFRVASGLDSMVLGEPQILGQMKDAFASASEAGTTGKILNRLFQNTFTVAKQVRTDTAIGASAVSVAYAAVELAKRIFAELSSKTVLLIGAGETMELVARHLRENGVRRVIVANRSIDRAQTLAAGTEGEAISLAQMPGRLHEADIVVSSTASTLPILGKGAMESALRKRKHRPMFLVDIAVPRDIEPQVSELRDVFLYTVDDLEGIIDRNLSARHEAALEAEKIIDLEVVRFMRWLRSLESVPTIRELRSNVQTISEQELEQAKRRLAKGDDPEQILEHLARSLTNKFTHAPSNALKDAAHLGGSGLLHAARKLFDLEES